MKRTRLATGCLALFSLGLAEACSAGGEDNQGQDPLATAGFGNAGTGSGSGGLAAGSGGFTASSGGFVPDFGSGGMIGSSGAPSSGGASPGTGGMDTGTGGMDLGTGGMDLGTGGMDLGTGGMEAGTGGMDTGTGGMDAGTGGKATGGGDCCPDGDCICRGSPPSSLSARNGSFRTQSFRGSTGTIYYPTDAEAPFSGIALCGGFTNTGPEMAGWGTFYASYGIVTVITTTGGLDFPDVRGRKLLASIEELKSQNTRSGSPIMGKMAGRYGTSGYSMGGGGTTLASQQDRTLKTSVGLAAWGPNGRNVQVPTLFLCGGADLIAPCSGSDGAYNAMPAGVPKMMLTIAGTGHLSWFGPTSAGGGLSGQAGLAFEKVFLDGDTRWKSLLLGLRGQAQKTANIQ